MEKKEKEGIGKWYMREREEERRRLQKKGERLLSLLNSLDEAVNNLRLRMQELEEKISK